MGINFKNLLDEMTLGIFLKDLDLKYIFCNENYAQKLGIRPSEIIGKSDYDFFPHQLANNYEKIDKKVLELKQTEKIVVPNEKCYTQISKSIKLNRNGKAEGIIGIVTEVTDEEKLEIEKHFKENQEIFEHNLMRLNIALDAAKIGTWNWNLITKEVVWDKRMYEIFEFDRDEKINFENFIEAIHKGDRILVEAKLKKAIENNDVYSASYRIINKNGNIRYVLGKGKCIYDKAGKPICLHGICIDETNRIETEMRLQSIKDKFFSYLDVVGSLFVGIDKNGNVELINSKCLNVLGYENKSEVIGKNWFDNFLPPESIEPVKKWFEKVVNQEVGIIEYVENSVKTKNGSYVEIAWHNGVLKNEKGEIIIKVSVGQDITEKKNIIAERDLLFNFSLNLMAVLDFDGNFKMINPAWEKLFGFTEMELKKMSMISFVHPQDVKRTIEKFEEVKKGNPLLNLENRCITKKGNYKWIIWKMIPYNDSFYCSAADVTELENRAVQLEEMNKKLETSNKELEQFAFAASHDLQEPLRKITSYLDLIQRRYNETLDDKGQQFIEYTLKGAERMKVLIKNLLDYSRVERFGKKFEMVDSNEIVKMVIDTFQRQISEKRAKINVQENLPQIYSNPIQLESFFLKFNRQCSKV